MSTFFSTQAPAQSLVTPGSVRLLAILRSWWAAYIARRIEQVAIAHLSSMSDRELKDIGLVRSDIVHAVKRITVQPFNRYC